MKKLLIAICLVIELTSTAQFKDSTYNTGNNYVGASHGNLVVFCGYDFIKVQPKFTSYLINQLNFVSINTNSNATPKLNRIASASYSSRVGSGKPSIVNISYYGRSLNNGIMVVDKCIINGNLDDVATVFIKYWETKMEFSDLKSKPDIIKYSISDKIIFTSNLTNGTATISITKS